jgi:hypothetical protein
VLLRDRDPDEGRSAADNDDDGPGEPPNASLRTSPGVRRVLTASATHSHWMMSPARPREPSIERITVQTSYGLNLKKR